MAGVIGCGQDQGWVGRCILLGSQYVVRLWGNEIQTHLWLVGIDH